MQNYQRSAGKSAAKARKGEVPRSVVLHGGDEARFLGDDTWALGLRALLPE